MSSLPPDLERKAKAEGAIEALEHIMESLCRRELGPGGRKHIKKLLVKYNNDLSRT